MKNENNNTYNKRNKTIREIDEELILIYTKYAIYDFDNMPSPPPIITIK
jgi:hypothetical protein